MSTEACMHVLLGTSSDAEHEQFGFLTASSVLWDRVADDWEIFKHTLELRGLDPVAHRLHECYNLPESFSTPWDYVAQDFMLTRNNHEEGNFLDGSWSEPWASDLTKIAHTFGELKVYIGKDNLVYPH